MKKIISLLFFLFLLLGCSEKESTKECGDGVCDVMERQKALCPEDCLAKTSPGTLPLEEPADAGTSFITYVLSEGIGDIAVKVTLPQTPRYSEGAPVLVHISTFFTPGQPVFDTLFLDITKMGFIHVTYLWPGKSYTEVSSDGTYDYGGEDSLSALRDVIRFASGQTPDINGNYISDLSAVVPLSNNIGLYAFSHPGIAATNVLAKYHNVLSVDYFVGRENPTVSTLSAMDLGYWDHNTPVQNPYYTYPESYSSSALTLDYSSVQWDDENNVPYFDVNGNNQADADDFIHGTQTPFMYDKSVYSLELTQALLDNGALTEASWPEDVATPEEAAELWDFRETVDNYALLSSSDVKVLLVFNEHDHVQPTQDKPNIHQAFDGFRNAGLWVRLNPDSAYVHWLDSSITVPDNNANTEPEDWNDINTWAYPYKQLLNSLVPLAAVAEMADRTYTDTWDENLDEILIDAKSPSFE